MVLRLNLQPMPHPSNLNVTVANGNLIASEGVSSTIHIFIDNEEFILDLFVIPLEVYDMVLGMHTSCTPWAQFYRTYASTTEP
jgi:hypothetical protein